MKQENFDYLSNQLKYLGFGEELKSDLRQHLQNGKDTFSLTAFLTYNAIEQNGIQYDLNFKKGGEDMYFLNSYHTTLNGETAKFYVNKGEKNITSKEAFNLMEGRAVYRELTNKEGEKYHAWQKIDVEKSQGENIRFKSFSDNYGYDLDAALKKVTDQKLYFGYDKEQVTQSLQKGNLVEVKNMDKSERYFVAADPQFKTVAIFNENGDKLKLNEINKEHAALENNQSSGMKM